jgi:uncharacterized protein with beta-barrel porin domain
MNSTLRNVLLAGTALVAAAYATEARAATVTVNGAPQVVAADPAATPAITFATDDIATVNDAINVTGTVTSAATNIGTLTLSGTTTVSGAVGVNGANVVKVINGGIAAKVATFSGTVDAGTLNVTGTGTVALGGTTNLTKLDFAGNDGIVSVAASKNLTATNVTNNAGVGTLNFLGGTQAVTGAIGQVNKLKVINSGQSSGITSFAGAVQAQTVNNGVAGGTNFSGLLTADLVNVNTGTVKILGAGANVSTLTDFAGNDGTVLLGDGANLTGDIDTSTVNTGTVTFAGASAVTGTVGATQAVKVLNAAGLAGKTVAISGAVKAQTVSSNAGTTTFNGLLTATSVTAGTGTVNINGAGANAGSISFGANDGTVSFGDGADLTGGIDATTAGKGTVTFAGSSTVTGAVGATQAVKVLNANGIAGKTVAITGAVKAVTMNTGAGTTNLGGVLTATTVNAGTGTLNFNAAGLNTATISFGANDGTVTFVDGANLTGGVDATAANKGTVTFAGSSTVSSTIGATQAVKVLNANGVGGKTLAVTGAVQAQTTNAGAGTLTLTGGLTGTTLNMGTGTVNLNATSSVTTVDFVGNDGTLNVAAGKNLTTTNINNNAATGTLSLLGGTQAVAGAVGSNTLKVINAGQAGGATSFSGVVKAATINVGSGSVSFADNVTGNVAIGSSAGAVTIAAGKNLTGSIDGTGAAPGSGGGSVTFTGATSGVTTVGSAATILKLLSVGGNLGTTGNFFAADTNTIGGNTVTIGGGGALTVGAGQTINSTVTTSTTAGHFTTAGAATVDLNAKVALTVGGTVAFTPGATTKVKIVDGGAGAGVATLAAGKLTVNGVNSGAGTTVKAGLLTITQDVTSAGQDLEFDITRAASAASATSDPTAQAVGTVLDTLTASPSAVIQSAQAYIQGAGTTTDLNDRLSSLAPTLDGSTTVSTLDAGQEVQGINDTRLAFLRTGEGNTGISAGSPVGGIGMWLQGYGQTATQDAKGGIAGYDARTVGGALGFDTSELLGGPVLGLAVNAGSTNADSKNSNTTATAIDNYGLTLYGSGRMGTAFLNGQVSYAYNTITTDRHNVGGAGITAHGATHSDQYSGKAAVGNDYEMTEGMTLTPVLSAAYAHLSTQGYTESGSGANLTVGASEVDVLNLGVGLTAGWKLKAGEYGQTLKPSVHVGYSYDALGDKVQVVSSFAGIAGSSFSTSGPEPARSQFNLGTGFVFSTLDNWDLSANYDYALRTSYSAHSGYLRATTHF